MRKFSILFLICFLNFCGCASQRQIIEAKILRASYYPEEATIGTCETVDLIFEVGRNGNVKSIEFLNENAKALRPAAEDIVNMTK